MGRITFLRIIENGFLNYWRNFWLSVAATAIMVITLFILSSLLILNNLAAVSLKALREKVDISIYFRQTVSEQIISQIQRQLELLPQVKSVAYVPPILARERFIELHKDEPLLIESVEQFSLEENPFPASFAVRVNDLSDYPTIINIFEEEKFTPFVKKITDKRDVVDRLERITTGIKNLGFGLTLAFGAVTLIVLFNTVRLTIYSRREEIEIMRLVGASNGYIRGPFVVEGIFYGIAGSIFTSLILFPLLWFLTPRISSFFEIGPSNFAFSGSNLWWLLVMQLLAGVILGIISSIFAVRKYLNT